MRCFHVSLLLSATFLASVSSAQSPLTILNNGFPIGAVGQSYAQALSASGGTQPYSWSATGQIPPGLVVNSVGTISGTPRTGGTYSFTLTVVDVRQATASKALSIVISGPGPAPLTVTIDHAARRRRRSELQPDAHRHWRNTALSMVCRHRLPHVPDAGCGERHHIGHTHCRRSLHLFRCGDRLRESYGDRYR